MHPLAACVLTVNTQKIVCKHTKGAYFKDDRNFSAFFDPLPQSERKMTSLLLYTMTSLLLILTAFGRPPSPLGCVHPLSIPPYLDYELIV